MRWRERLTLVTGLLKVARLQMNALRGRWDVVIRGVCRALDMEEADLRDPRRLRERLDAFRERTGESPESAYLLLLPMALASANRPADALRVFDVVLDVPEGGVYAETVPRHLRDAVAADMRSKVLMNLFSVLARLERVDEAFDLVIADLVLEFPGAVSSPDAFAEALRQRLDGLGREDRALYPMVLLLLVEARYGGEWGAAVDTALGLDTLDGSPSEVAALLGSRFDGVPAPQALPAVAALAHRLCGRSPERAAALVERYLGAGPGDYADIDRLAGVWRAATAGANPEAVVPLWQVWIESLADGGRGSDARAVVEADSGLAAGAAADLGALARVLEHRVARLASSNFAAGYISALAIGLELTGGHDEAVAVADWFLRGYEPLARVPRDGDPNVVHVAGLLALRLGRTDASDDERVWEACGRSVAYLRASVDVGRLSLADRRRLADHVDLLRGRVREAAARLAGDEERVITAQLWDAELGQRVLFEEFLLTTVQPVEPAEAPRDAWPLPGPEPVGPVPEGPLPDDADDGLGPRRPRRPRGHRAVEPGRPFRPAGPAPEPWLAEAERLVRAGVGRELLAEAVGDGGVLVRAGFRADGSLTWAALGVSGSSVRLVASGRGAAGDRTLLRWARFRYRIGLLVAGADGTLDPGGEVWTPAAALVSSLTRAVEDLRAASTPGQVEAALAGLDRSSVATEERLADRFRELLDATPAPGPELDALVGLLEAAPDLDGVTARYLAEVAGIWPVDSLADAVTEDTDLVWQLEDVLQAFPVAHHPLADGTPLYLRIRSSRVSLSLLLTIVQQRVDREFAGRAGRLLALSSFDPDDPAARYEPWFHHGLRQLAGEDLTCLHAAVDPPGSAGALRAALDADPAYDVVSVCGHGSADDAAVELADGVWRGDGCDWREVRLLVLVSCSVGGLEQVEDREVEGLCVRLALHRARSVLACRWPVAAPQAIAFAREVVARFLVADGPHRRARAVNEARRHFAGAGRLNTTAAFELYGIG
ncbi:CHAT domain-containing protein [Streptomyces sp. NPDC056508]|uniref:CHAT domain-containing protein n=1 Tax=Streptomyces sp. NPDC056508 TaxID=3345845 RepID=UPI003676483C